LLSKFTHVALDRLAWSAARSAVDAVRFQPAHTKLLMACSAGQADGPQRWVSGAAAVLARPRVARLLDLPHLGVRAVAGLAARWFGPTASALVRFASGAAAAAADRLSAVALESVLRARAHPGLLVPHAHDAAVLAVDMRSFSQLTLALDDTPYLAGLLEEYLTALTGVVERHRGLVFQYTGDGLLALFIAELAGGRPGAMLDRLVNEMCPQLHREFDDLHERWRADWQAAGRPAVAVGLGAGLSYGRVTMGYIGAYGKKQFAALGEPVNLAALLCADAEGAPQAGGAPLHGFFPPLIAWREPRAEWRPTRSDASRITGATSPRPGPAPPATRPRTSAGRGCASTSTQLKEHATELHGGF